MAKLKVINFNGTADNAVFERNVKEKATDYRHKTIEEVLLKRKIRTLFYNKEAKCIQAFYGTVEHVMIANDMPLIVVVIFVPDIREYFVTEYIFGLGCGVVKEDKSGWDTLEECLAQDHEALWNEKLHTGNLNNLFEGKRLESNEEMLFFMLDKQVRNKKLKPLNTLKPTEMELLKPARPENIEVMEEMF